MPSKRPERPAQQCTSKNGEGERCKRWAIHGGNVCFTHGGNAPQVKAKAAVRDAVSRWTDGKQPLDPVELLYRVMTVTAERAEQHADALDRLIAEYGWDAAFVGDTYTVSDTGKPVKVGEYARQLAQWEQLERRHAADLAVKAIAANLAERNVRLEEAKARIVLDALNRALVEAGLDEQTCRTVTSGTARHLRLAPG